MKRGVLAVCGVVTIAVTLTAGECPPPPAGFPKFTWQEIASDFKIGYAVHIADVDGDKKPDIVVVDKERVVWYENPTWKMRTITQGKAKPDNVCICSLDIDKDGKLDFVLGAGWKPFDTKTPGTLQWLRRKASLDEEWEMFPIPCEEPTVHRVAAGGMIVTDRNQFTMVPLMGRSATKDRSFLDGEPVRIISYAVPNKPTDPTQWYATLVNHECHVIHNFAIGQIGPFSYLALASHEGIKLLLHDPGNKSLPLQGDGIKDTDNKVIASPTSEIAVELMMPEKKYRFATVEPWHGNTIVTYDRVVGGSRRVVIDDHLRWGHAIKIEKLTDEQFLIAGVRDNPNPKQGDTFTEKRGVRLYRKNAEKWDRYILEDGGVAVEDLQVADLDGDGKPEIIAVGRATGNCRIYWNKGK